MSGQKSPCEKPTKSWDEYTEEEIDLYLIRNMKRTDCSFEIPSGGWEKPTKVERSFKWMLREISPVLKKLLDKDENRAKNWENIEIEDPNFGVVIYFAQTKTMQFCRDSVLNYFKAAKTYKINALDDELTRKIFADPSDLNFVDLFEFSYEDERYTELLKRRMETKDTRGVNADVTERFKNVKKFSLEKFTEFFHHINKKIDSVDCLFHVESFLLASVIKRPIYNREKQLNSTEKSVVDFFMKRIDFGSILNDSIRQSKLLSKNVKEQIFATKFD